MLINVRKSKEMDEYSHCVVLNKKLSFYTDF